MKEEGLLGGNAKKKSSKNGGTKIYTIMELQTAARLFLLTCFLSFVIPLSSKYLRRAYRDNMQAPVIVMSQSQSFLIDVRKLISLDTQSGDRQFGRKAQLSNITAAKTCDTLPIFYLEWLLIDQVSQTLFDHVLVPKPCSKCSWIPWGVSS